MALIRTSVPDSPLGGGSHFSVNDWGHLFIPMQPYKSPPDPAARVVLDLMLDLACTMSRQTLRVCVHRETHERERRERETRERRERLERDERDTREKDTRERDTRHERDTREIRERHERDTRETRERETRERETRETREIRETDERRETRHARREVR